MTPASLHHDRGRRAGATASVRLSTAVSWAPSLAEDDVVVAVGDRIVDGAANAVAPEAFTLAGARELERLPPPASTDTKSYSTAWTVPVTR